MATDPNAHEPGPVQVEPAEHDASSVSDPIEPTEGEEHDNAIHVKRD